jgi:hypothetical protein
MEQIKITREKAVNELVEHCVDQDYDGDILAAVLREGCLGYDNMAVEDIIEEYNNIFSDGTEEFIVEDEI